MSALLRVALYARYSTDDQDQSSTAQQFAECREYAMRPGLSVIAEFSDKARSGGDDARPGLLALQAAAVEFPGFNGHDFDFVAQPLRMPRD
jgi:site-specific DNA recombinase